MIAQVVRAEDVPEVCLREGVEYSRRLITKERNHSERMSFHITQYAQSFDEIVTGDGIHEYVLYCLSGSAELESDEGWTRAFDKGAALYLETQYRFRLTVVDGPLEVAVACSPPVE